MAGPGHRRLLGTGFVAAALAFSPALQAFEPHCHQPTHCTANPASCIRAPSSLPDVDGTDYSDSDGFILGSRCGVHRTMGVVCGNYIGRDVCPDGATCECGPGHPPCETGIGPVIEAAFLETLPGLPEVALFEGVADYGKGLRAVTPAAATSAIRERLTPFSSSLPRELTALWQRLAALKSVYWKADVEVWLAASIGPGGKEIAGRGTYEYWEEGNRYKTRVDLPKDLGLSQITEIACDGTLRQIFWADMGTITVSREDTRMVPVALFNPLFLPLSFLAPSSEICARCELRLADLRAARPRSGNDASPSGTFFRFGKEIVYEVTLSGAGEITGVVAKEPRGRLVSRALFSDYRPVPGGGWRLPRTIRFEVISEAPGPEAPVLVTTYRIERLNLNPQFEASTFQLAWDRAEYVWDDERQTHLKRPGRLAEPREKPRN